MTPLKYIRESGVANTKEIMDFAKSDPTGYKELQQMARDQMTFNGIEVEEPKPQTAAA